MREGKRKKISIMEEQGMILSSTSAKKYDCKTIPKNTCEILK